MAGMQPRRLCGGHFQWTSNKRPWQSPSGTEMKLNEHFLLRRVALLCATNLSQLGNAVSSTQHAHLGRTCQSRQIPCEDLWSVDIRLARVPIVQIISCPLTSIPGRNLPFKHSFVQINMAPSTIEGLYYTSEIDTAEQVVLASKSVNSEKMDKYIPLLVNVAELPPLDPERASPDSERAPSPGATQEKDIESNPVHQETIAPTIVDIESPSVVQQAGPPSSSPAVQAPAIPLSVVPGTTLPASTRLRKMIFETSNLIVCPGVYDGLSARTAMEVGFDGLYMVRTK